MPLSIILWVFLAFVAGVFLYVLLNLYHIFRFGKFDGPTVFMTGLFLAGFVFILFVSYLYLAPIDWSAPIVLFSNDGFSSN
jgi:hypothetical protein